MEFQRLISTIEELCSFYDKCLKIDSKSLRLVIHASDIWLYDMVKKANIRYDVVKSYDDLSKFRHRYGIDNIYGVNINFVIKKPTGKDVQFANFNILVNSKNEYLGAEFGMGIGLFISGLYNLSDSLEASFASYMEFPVNSPLISWKIKDALSVLVHLFKEEIWPGGKGQRDICKCLSLIHI
ncbi:hypothetical protein BN3590_01498 [Clostridium sp. C105KSO15]|nr:hypothetical protein BN3590_01498 [Clostridium sp. C105KSO15]